MITIRSGAYTKEDLVFLANVLEDGLLKNCYVLKGVRDSTICSECKNRIACNDALSAFHHTLSVLYTYDEKFSNEK